MTTYTTLIQIEKELKEKDKKIKSLTEALVVSVQHGHLLANMIDKSRHWTPSFNDCNEQTCIDARKMMDSLDINYWRY